MWESAPRFSSGRSPSPYDYGVNIVALLDKCGRIDYIVLPGRQGVSISRAEESVASRDIDDLQ